MSSNFSFDFDNICNIQYNYIEGQFADALLIFDSFQSMKKHITVTTLQINWATMRLSDLEPL